MGYVLAVTWVGKPRAEDRIAGVLRTLMPLTQAEPGCIRYVAHRSLDDPRRFFLYEEYVDEAGLEAHVATEHFQRHVIGEAIPRLESRERLAYEPL